MKKLLFFLPAVLFSFSLLAQQPKGSNLTIFSEDGNKFFLYLNGELQNNKPQTNLRVEDLLQSYYNCKIIFQDTALDGPSKNMLYVKDEEGMAKEVVYKIKTDKNNAKKTLKLFSQQDIAEDYLAPSNVAVYHYGNPFAVGEVVQTTTTTTTTGDNVNMSVNVGGIGMNVNINDPLYSESVTTTTTTTSGTTSSAPAHGPKNNPRSNYNGDCAFEYAMKSSDFEEAKATIKNSSFEDTKLSTAKEIISSNCLKAEQVAQICQLFSFEESKLEFAKFAYKHTIDRSNYFKVNNSFTFSSSKEELSDYIRTNK